MAELFCPIAVVFCPIAVAFCPIAVPFCPIAVAFCPIAVAFCPIAVVFCPIAVEFADTPWVAACNSVFVRVPIVAVVAIKLSDVRSLIVTASISLLLFTFLLLNVLLLKRFLDIVII